LSVKGCHRGRSAGRSGPLTRARLRALRERYRPPTSALADRRVRSALGRLGQHRYGFRLLRRGKIGMDVAALQFELRYHGFPAPANGVLGEPTKLAVMAVQR